MPSKHTNETCGVCGCNFDIAHVSKWRHIKKYGKVLCKKCTSNIISQSSKDCWKKGICSLSGLRSRSSNDLSISAKKAWSIHREKFMSAKASHSKKMIKKWQEPSFRMRYAFTTEEFINIANKIHNNKYTYAKTIYVASDKKVCITCPTHGDFWQTARQHVNKEHGCPKCINALSYGHQNIVDFISTLGVNCISNCRNIIDPYEIDIWIESLNLGIEYNGIYWHSSKHVNRLYHQKKSLLCMSKHIKLLQFWETEWDQQKPIIESIIKQHLGLSIRIYARDTEAILLNEQEASAFFNNSHLKGHRPAKLYIGLKHNNQIISALSLSKHHKYGYELIRYATSLGITVVGGFSKLLKNIIKLAGIAQIFSYADLRYSHGLVYERFGFKIIGHTKPNYYYIKNGKIYNRQEFQKHKLKKRLRKFDADKSEVENMLENGYQLLWDAGNLKLLWTS